jgi:hypothetical protein
MKALLNFRARHTEQNHIKNINKTIYGMLQIEHIYMTINSFTAANIDNSRDRSKPTLGFC